MQLPSPENTLPSLSGRIRDPDLADPLDLEAFGHLYTGFHTPGRKGLTMQRMAEMYFQADWKLCPKGCGREVMTLYDETQCYDCWKTTDAETKNQLRLGDYLRRTIGPYGIERYTFSGFEVTSDNKLAFENAFKFDPDNDNLFLVGPCGTGKTHLAGAILKKCAAENKDIVWATSMWINRLFRMRTRDEEDGLLSWLGRAELLVVDDIGVGKDTEFTLRIMHEIIGRRIADLRHGLVMTSNLQLDDMAKKFGDDRLTSRISGHCRIYELGGDDRRLSNAMRGQSRWRIR